MVEKADVLDLQSVSVEGLVGPSGADRMYVTVGVARVVASPDPVTYSALIEPRLEPGQFRRAIATASLAAAGGALAISDVQADWDDESEMVELRFTATGNAQAIAFQVLTFAAAPAG
jgi:hypothetical protein